MRVHLLSPARFTGLVAALVVIVLAIASDASIAQAPPAASNAFVPKYTGTLKRIFETKTVRVGHRENSPPFAFLDAKGKPIGYSLDLCEVVVEEIANELH